MSRTVGITEFRKSCSQLIDRLVRDRKPVTITRRGKPVAVLVPADEAGARRLLFGAMAGTVLRYDEPCAPAVDAETWAAKG